MRSQACVVKAVSARRYNLSKAPLLLPHRRYACRRRLLPFHSMFSSSSSSSSYSRAAERTSGGNEPQWKTEVRYTARTQSARPAEINNQRPQNTTNKRRKKTQVRHWWSFDASKKKWASVPKNPTAGPPQLGQTAVPAAHPRWNSFTRSSSSLRMNCCQATGITKHAHFYVNWGTERPRRRCCQSRSARFTCFRAPYESTTLFSAITTAWAQKFYFRVEEVRFACISRAFSDAQEIN